jgi:hypothetical protein
MKSSALVFLIFLATFLHGFGQVPGSCDLCRTKLSRLKFMTGQWKGTAWTLGANQQRNTFEMTQNVQFKLDSTLLQIERTGVAEGQIIYDELAIITYSIKDSSYIYNSYLATGNNGRFTGILRGNRFYWYPYENIGYAITINEKGQWYEIGQMKQEKHVIPFTGMTLNRKKDAK